jgi:hypothetical protein
MFVLGFYERPQEALIPGILDLLIDEVQYLIQHGFILLLQQRGSLSSHDCPEHTVGAGIVSFIIFGIDHETDLLRRIYMVRIGVVIQMVFNEERGVPGVSDWILSGCIGALGIKGVLSRGVLTV